MKKAIAVFFVLMLLTEFSFAQKIWFSDTTNKWITYWVGKALSQGYVNHQWGKDTIVNGLSYRYLSSKLIREDTNTRRIYYLRSDSTEQVLYDYNLKKGDTLNCMFLYITTPQYFKHYVKRVDSILIQGVYHKLWEFAPVTLVGQPQSNVYYVLEGIGCTYRPVFTIRPYYDVIGSENITCFSTQGNIVTAKWPVGWFTGNDIVSPGTCVLDVKEVHTERMLTIAPNPANEATRIYLSKIIQSGSLSITNILGQTVLERKIKNEATLPIGNSIKAKGIYFYNVVDNERQERYTGKLIFE